MRTTKINGAKMKRVCSVCGHKSEFVVFWLGKVYCLECNSYRKKIRPQLTLRKISYWKPEQIKFEISKIKKEILEART